MLIRKKRIIHWAAMLIVISLGYQAVSAQTPPGAQVPLQPVQVLPTATLVTPPPTPQDRFTVIQGRLNSMSVQLPGLNQKTQISISGGTLLSFFKALAENGNLNINVDPTLTQHISYRFTDETPADIIVYLAKTYSLDVLFFGNIITIGPYRDPAANAPPPPRELLIRYDTASRLLTLDLHDDTLLNVARKITQLTDKNLVVLPEAFYKKVTGYVQNLPVQSVLEKLAVTNQLRIDKTNDETYVINQLKPDEELTTKPNEITGNDYVIRKVNKGGPGGGNPSSSSLQYSGEERKGQKLLNLNVTNAPIKDVVKNLSEYAGVNYFLYSDLSGNVSANVNNVGYEDILRLVLMNSPYAFSKNEGGVYMIGERSMAAMREDRLIQLKYRSVDSLINMIPDEYRKNVLIKEFKELNSFLVNGPEAQINDIQNFVNQVDKKVPMITIEIIIMDVTKTKSLSTGISMGVNDSVKTGGSILGAGGTNFTFGAKDINSLIDHIGLNNVFNIGHVLPDFYVQLQAMSSLNNVDLRETPKLSTLNGHPATLSIGSTRYYTASTQNVIGSLSTSTVVTQQYYPVEANLSLDIVPFVSGDENVTLTIGVNITAFTDNNSTNTTTPPPTTTSKFKSIIRIKNEETVLLGGIETNEKDETSSGTPLLDKIPLLKWLFTSKTKTDTKTVSIVFIKPTIVF